MITIKTDTQIAGMKRSGVILTKTHHAIRRILRPGLTTMQVNDFAEAFMRYKKAIPAQLGYEGFPFALCTSVNDEVCHGFPNDRPLRDGDILSIDNVVNFEGYLSDSCWSYAIGDLSPEDQKLMEVTEKAMYIGIDQALPGNHLNDIGKAIQEYVEGKGFSVVRDFTGHGIGQEMHEDPMVLHYGIDRRGPKLRKNMVITVEPMINIGDWRIKIDDNGWTARTQDGKKSCQFEHTFAIKEGGAEILTDQSQSSLDDEELDWIGAYKFK